MPLGSLATSAYQLLACRQAPLQLWAAAVKRWVCEPSGLPVNVQCAVHAAGRETFLCAGPRSPPSRAGHLALLLPPLLALALPTTAPHPLLHTPLAGHPAVVLDDFITDETRSQLLHFLLHGEDAACGTAGGRDGDRCPQQQQQQEQQLDPQQPEQHGAEVRQALPPGARWERRTTDMAGGAPTWGVRQHVLQELASGQLPAMQVGGIPPCLPLAACCFWR